MYNDVLLVLLLWPCWEPQCVDWVCAIGHQPSGLGVPLNWFGEPTDDIYQLMAAGLVASLECAVGGWACCCVQIPQHLTYLTSRPWPCR
jgi:hypothetical protein